MKRCIKKAIEVIVSAAISASAVVPTFAQAQLQAESIEFKETVSAHSKDTFRVCVSEEKSGDKLMTIDLNAQKISLSLPESKTESQLNGNDDFPKLEIGQTRQLDSVLPNVSVRYRMREQGLKEDFILHSKKAQNAFDLQYNIGDLRAEQVNAQNILLLDKDNRAKIIISAPYMTDAAGVQSSAVFLKIKSVEAGVLSARLTADSSWLQDYQRKYPVEVDPRYGTIPATELQKGDSGEDVAVLKNMLFEAGYGAGISMHDVRKDLLNTHFGSVAEKLVITFQKAKKLKVTGVADTNTLKALREHLEGRRILDTAEHIEKFLRRSQSRVAQENSGFFKSIADFFGRINLVDLLVTVGIGAVVVGISVFCAPVTAVGIAGMLVGGAIIGSVANGVSEYAQQKAVGDEVDMKRVAIKAAGGAAKGVTFALPGVGVSVVVVGLGVGVEGAAENFACTAVTEGPSWEAAKNALLNGTFQGVAAAGVAFGVSKVVTEIKPLIPVAKTVQGTAVAGSTVVAATTTTTTDTGKDVKTPALPKYPISSDLLKEKSANQSKKMELDSNDKKTPETPNSSPQGNPLPNLSDLSKKPSGKPDATPSSQESEITTEQMIKDTRTKTIKDVQKVREKCHPQQVIDMEKKCYEKDLKVAAEIRKSVEEGKRKLTQQEQHKLIQFESTAKQAIRDRERAQQGDLNAQRVVEEESRMTVQQVMAEQIRRYDKMIGKQFFDGLADMYT